MFDWLVHEITMYGSATEFKNHKSRKRQSQFKGCCTSEAICFYPFLSFMSCFHCSDVNMNGHMSEEIFDFILKCADTLHCWKILSENRTQKPLTVFMFVFFCGTFIFYFTFGFFSCSTYCIVACIYQF